MAAANNTRVATIQIKQDQIMITQDHDRGITVCFKYRGNHCDWAVFDSDDQDLIIDWIITPIPEQRWEFSMDDCGDQDRTNIPPK